MARPQKIKGRPQKPAAAPAAASRHRPALAPKCLPIRKFAELHGIHEVTVWRALRDGRLKAVVIGKRKLILLDSVQPAPGA